MHPPEHGGLLFAAFGPAALHFFLVLSCLHCQSPSSAGMMGLLLRHSLLVFAGEAGVEDTLHPKP